MIDIKELEHLAPMANEMLSGLHADEAMKRRILRDLLPAQRQRRNGLAMWFAVERSGLNAFAGAAGL